MERNHKPGTSNQSNQNDFWKDWSENKPTYLTMQYLAQRAHLTVERKIKEAEAEIRTDAYKASMLRRQNLPENNPAHQNVHVRDFEEYHKAEALKRYEEIRTIDMQLVEIEKRLDEIKKK